MQFSLEDAATGLLVLIGGILSYFGIQNGRRASKHKGEGGDVVELAGAVIDKEQAASIVASMRENTMTIREQANQLRENNITLLRHIGAVDAFHEDLSEVKSEVREMMRELRSELREAIRETRNKG